jgi:integrase/recombinase XerD
MPLPRNCYYPIDWPGDLQVAWTAACRPGSLLRQTGIAARWSEPTKTHVIRGIGTYLFWLRERGVGNHSAAFADLITPANVIAYAAARRLQSRDATVRTQLVGLLRGMAVMYPHRDWSWIRRLLASIPEGRAASRKRKQPRLRHSLELLELGLSLAKRADAATEHSPLRRAIMFRNGTIIALLALRPIRRKNAAGLIIGRHITRSADGWRLVLAAAEVKNREPYNTQIPTEVGALLDRYLAVHRPILLAAGRRQASSSTTSRLWITQFGTPPTPEGFAQIICIETTKAFGKPVPPHFFRDSAMTSWAMDLPKQIRSGKHLLGNRSFAVVESAYNMAGSNEAAAKLQQIIRALRQDTGSRTPALRLRELRTQKRYS